MRGIRIVLRDDHYRLMIAAWMRDLCTSTGSLMEKNDKVSFDMTLLVLKT